MWQGILEFLRSADRPVAWTGAVMLAAGGTAVVVILYLQWQRWAAASARRRTHRPAATARAAAGRSAPAKPARRPDPAGLAAYRRDFVAQTAPATPAAGATVPVAPPSAAGAQAAELDSLLGRLREAAARLEDLARRRIGRVPVMDDPDGGPDLDVEFLHRGGGSR